jgi:hypothetical protein
VVKSSPSVTGRHCVTRPLEQQFSHHIKNYEGHINFEWATETSLPKQNISNLKLNQRSPPPCTPRSTEGKVVYHFSHIFSGKIWFHLGELFAIKVRNRLDVMQRDGNRSCLTTLQPDIQNVLVFVWPKEHAEYNANY